MSRRRYQWDEAVMHLHQSCERLSAFINDFGGRKLQVRREGNIFAALSRAVAYQQLSTKAAGTIHGRFLDLFANGAAEPERTVKLGIDSMRSVGLSQAKSLSILDLAQHSLDGRLPSPQKIGRMTDDEVIESLCMVRGIGPWTAQMYLIFNLGRPDVMPATDLGVQKGVQHIYSMRSLPDPAKVRAKTRRFGPYRSAASWYFWRAADL